MHCQAHIGCYPNCLWGQTPVVPEQKALPISGEPLVNHPQPLSMAIHSQML